MNKMNDLKHILKRTPLHPYLLALYSVLTLVAFNLGKFVPWMAARSVVFFLVAIAVVYWMLNKLLRSPHKAALVLTLFLLAFFTYGHVHRLVGGIHLLGINFGRHRTLVIIWLVLLLVGLFLILRARRDLQGVTQALNVILIIALCFPIIQIVRYEIGSLVNKPHSVKTQQSALGSGYPVLAAPAGQSLPDIYYIILDTYARQDALQQYFKFDNSNFINSLQNMGFYVADCSQSNYATTELSLASSLNLDYLDALGDNSPQIYTHPQLYQLIQDNAARQMLEKAGYRVIAFDSGFSPTEWKNTDVYFSPAREPFKTYVLGGINPFEALEMQTSAGLLLYDAKSVLPNTQRSFLDAAYTEHRERILYEFNKLASVPEIDAAVPQESRPKFVFIHILAPHSPFVFGAKGEIVGRRFPFTLNNDLDIADPALYIDGYRNQIQYINRRILQALQAIITDSATPPVIILQGDHGPKAGIASQSGRMAILNAYYLPGGSDALYQTITPVNSFRVIFNRYLNGQFDLLPDISYFSTYQKPDVFTAYPNDPGTCAP